jgi:hypothetical protein
VALVLYFLMEAITFLVSFKRLKRFRGWYRISKNDKSPTDLLNL